MFHKSEVLRHKFYVIFNNLPTTINLYTQFHFYDFKLVKNRKKFLKICI